MKRIVIYNGVIAIFTADSSESVMTQHQTIAVDMDGLVGDHNSEITLISKQLLDGTGFSAEQLRRNIVTYDVPLYELIGHRFYIGDSVILEGLMYCKAKAPDGEDRGLFSGTMLDRGGIIAKVLRGGVIRVNDYVKIPYNY